MQWFSFPKHKPGCAGWYLAGHESVLRLFWSGTQWKTQPMDESDLTERVRWWSQVPLPPQD